MTQPPRGWPGLGPLAVLAAGLAGSALFLGSPPLLLLSTIPLGLLVAVALLPRARLGAKPTATVRGARYVGQLGTLAIDLHVQARDDLVLARVLLPETVEVVDGTDVAAATGSANLELRAALRPLARGTYTLGPLEIEAVHPTGFGPAQHDTIPAIAELRVGPRPPLLRRARMPGGLALTLAPEEAASRAGLRTTDFREIRAYQPGDPPKNVNWKATARRWGPHAEILVNEYEVEGRRGVYILLDGTRSMAVGTTVQNGVEAGVEAAAGVATALLRAGYRVGLAIAGADAGPMDSGSQHIHRILRQLARLPTDGIPTEPNAAIRDVLTHARGWLHRARPLLVLITRAETLDPAIVRPYIARRGQVTLMAPLVHRLVPLDEPARPVVHAMLDAFVAHRLERLHRQGINILPWDPARETILSKLFRRRI